MKTIRTQILSNHIDAICSKPWWRNRQLTNVLSIQIIGDTNQQTQFLLQMRICMGAWLPQWPTTQITFLEQTRQSARFWSFVFGVGLMVLCFLCLLFGKRWRVRQYARNTFAHSRSLSLTISLSLSHSCTHTHSLSLSSFPLSLSLSHTHLVFLSLKHTHKHTPTRIFRRRFQHKIEAHISNSKDHMSQLLHACDTVTLPLGKERVNWCVLKHLVLMELNNQKDQPKGLEMLCVD